MSSKKKTRGILYVYWGNIDSSELDASVESVKKTTNLPVEVRKLEVEPGCGLALKAKMYDLSPFDETLFLDTDTVVFDDVSFGFEAAGKYGIALAIAPACYVSRGIYDLDDAYPEYNTGVIFFIKNDVNRELFRRWDDLAPQYKGNDQTSFSLAAIELGISPYILPQNWNLRAHLGIAPIFGPIKVWHSRMLVPENVQEWNRNKPYIFGKLAVSNGVTRIVDFNSKIDEAGTAGIVKRAVRRFLK